MGLIYQAANPAVLGSIPRDAKRILDLGCGDGALGVALKGRGGCHITGVTCSEDEAVHARSRLDQVIVADLNHWQPEGLQPFDTIIASHVLEHLHEPEVLLGRIRGLLGAGGFLIVALPNILFWKQRIEFLRGNFRYTDGGLMDRTHVRFFDWKTANQLLGESGFVVTESFADGNLPLARFLLGPGRRLKNWSLRRFPGLFGFQFVFTCRKDGRP
jgi:cyclopropane fatty-acyl-phospholipid synthase-like methyltransferase